MGREGSERKAAKNCGISGSSFQLDFWQKVDNTEKGIDFFDQDYLFVLNLLHGQKNEKNTISSWKVWIFKKKF